MIRNSGVRRPNFSNLFSQEYKTRATRATRAARSVVLIRNSWEFPTRKVFFVLYQKPTNFVALRPVDVLRFGARRA